MRRTTRENRGRRLVRLITALIVATTFLLGAASATSAAAPPRIDAPAAIAVEITTGDVVFDRRADQQRSIASTTKLMTALVVLEAESDLQRQVAIGVYDGSPAESLAHLRPGDRMTVKDLLGALLLPSGNDAAVALARGTAGSVSRFVTQMNRRARALGLRARFRNPIGLDASGHHASAADLVKLTLLLRRYPVFRQIVDRRSMRLTSASPPIVVANRNLLVQGYSWVDGVKTGHTRRAGYSLVASGKQKGISVITVVLGDSSEGTRDADSLALLRYALGRYHRTRVVRQGAVVARLPLRYRDEHVDVVARTPVSRIARKGEKIRTRVIGLPVDVEGPLPAGRRLGTIEVIQRGRVVDRVAAVTRSPVAQASFWQRVDDELHRGVVQLLIGSALLCTVLLIVLLRRTRRPEPRSESPRDASPTA